MFFVVVGRQQRSWTANACWSEPILLERTYVISSSTGVGGRGASKRTPKTFDLVKIRYKTVDIWAKCVKTFAKSLYVLRFRKNAPKIKVQTFFWRSCYYLVLFGQVRKNLGMFGGNSGKNPSHPQQFACCCTYKFTFQFKIVSVSLNNNFLLA